MAITTVNPDYVSSSDKWQRVRDVVAGSDTVKSKGRVYLPSLLQSKKDYENYLSRAQFVPYTSRILSLSLGQLFRNAPTTSGLPEYISADVDLRGTNLGVWSRNIARELMITNRVGLWIDYSDVLMRPYISTYRAEEVVNWFYGDSSSGETALQFVVLSGYTSEIIDYEPRQTKTYTTLSINADGEYQVDRYSEDLTKKGKLILNESIIPAVDGQPLDYIPFVILDLTGDPSHIHNAPLLDVATVNLGHYRNSADHENRLHFFGTPTLVTSGYEGKTIPIGGHFNVDLQGKAQYLEISNANPIADELKRKEELIALLGSSMLSGRGRYVSSAETASIQADGDYATLADIGNAMSEQISRAFSILAIWLSEQETTEPVRISYNTEFTEPSLEAGELTELTQAVLSGLISYDAYHYQLERNKFYRPGTTIESERQAIKQTQRDLIDSRSQIPGYTS